MIVAKPAAPGEHKLRARIAELNATREKAQGRTADRPNQNKSRFDQATTFTRGLEPFAVVNGNDLRPVSLRSSIQNDMWSTPPAIAQKLKRAKAQVEWATLEKAKAIITIPAPTT
ncbi:hypothetical protein PCASD_25828 [Puccinia coronata f. sp. avenae]|uniref:Uncharacterized protein n=1 Tax=Puccinia coronata f. sp. avenae TaxID=200324 RepID=A0A2N5TKA2_9BASI|nr:hypothetical protein PCASD_25828 [Puccinia coronata f. sp. avenae]